MIKRRKPLKRTPIKRKKKPVSYFEKKQTKPKKPIKTTENQREKYIQDLNFNSRIWGAREHVCAECGKPIPPPWTKANFSHYLNKNRWRKLRYCAENIDILCFDCHQRWEFGTDHMTMKIYDEDRRARLIQIDKEVPNSCRKAIHLYAYFLIRNITSNWQS